MFLKAWLKISDLSKVGPVRLLSSVFHTNNDSRAEPVTFHFFRTLGISQRFAAM